MYNQITIHKGHFVDVNSILLCKADANYTHIFFKDGTKYLSAYTLAVFHEKLINYNFFRPNRSVLFNLDAMELSNYTIDSGSFFLKNAEGSKGFLEISISRNRKKEFNTLIQAKSENALNN
jgi:two-component system, LytTR family, response regulator